MNFLGNFLKTFFALVLFILVLHVPTAVLSHSPDGENSAAAISNEGLAASLKILNLGTSPYTTVNPANEMSKKVNELYALFTWIGLGIVSLVLLIFIVVVYRFRESKHPVAKDIKGNFLLELAWTTMPIIILIIIGVPTIRLLFKIRETPQVGANAFYFASNPEQTFSKVLNVKVIAHQWWWEFEYLGWNEVDPNSGNSVFTAIDKVTANEPLFPVGIPVNLTLISEDVIHSLWLPRIAGKKDVMPGRMVEGFGWMFEKTGTYAGECALYCGASHASMRFNAHAVSMEEFNKWLNWGKGQLVVKSASAKRGQEFVASCMSCHTMKGVRDFIPRQQRYDQALQAYEADMKKYEADLAVWEEKNSEDNRWHRQIVADPTRPRKPYMPRMHEGTMVTVAPDLTDLRFRDVILAGMRKNNAENLLAWIKDPPSIKEDNGLEAASIRMPAYDQLYSDTVINDIVSFLLEAEYSESQMLQPYVIDYDIH